MKRILILGLTLMLILSGCNGNSGDSENGEVAKEETQAEQQKTPEKKGDEKKGTAKEEAWKSNKYCTMTGAEFIQLPREERRSVIIRCEKDYERRYELWDVESVLDTANRYFVTSERWEAPLKSFLDDYLDGNIK